VLLKGNRRMLRPTRKRRLTTLEGKVGFDSARLIFQDGTSRYVRIPRRRNDRLILLLAALRFNDDPDVQDQDTGRRKCAPLLRLFRNAVTVETPKNSRLLNLVHNLCVTAEEQKGRQSNAH
jgi:hypothetical protein